MQEIFTPVKLGMIVISSQVAKKSMSSQSNTAPPIPAKDPGLYAMPRHDDNERVKSIFSGLSTPFRI